MCTVTFIPQSDGFILSSNRDEQASRSPRNITRTELHGRHLLFPRDEGAGGTWIATSDQGQVGCLLNGAFTMHRRRPPYRLSRGIMLLDFFAYASAREFMDSYDLYNIEPFTFIMYDRGALWELRWDGRQAYRKELDPGAFHIWSSATLYTPEIKEKRRAWFADWRQRHDRHDLPAILDFHRNAGEGDPWNDVIMNRNGVVQTVSITNIIHRAGEVSLWYHDLVNDNFQQAKIPREGEMVESY